MASLRWNISVSAVARPRGKAVKAREAGMGVGGWVLGKERVKGMDDDGRQSRVAR